MKDKRAQSKNLITLFSQPKARYRLEQIREIFAAISWSEMAGI
jgi:hypothetical protein